MPAEADYHGAGAADAVKSLFAKVVQRFNPKASITVQTIEVCNGEQPAYRVDDPLGTGSGGYMVVIPGTLSTGLINYEAHRSGDPLVNQTVEKICWP